MACRGCLERLLKLLNFLLTVTGMAMVGYGIYLLVEWNRISGDGDDPISPVSSNPEILALGRPMLLVVSLTESILDKLPKVWFIYMFIGIGVILFIISFFGCIGAVTRSGCCLSCYSFLVILLILAELGAAAFIFFDHSWKDLIPADKTGNFDMMYDFLKGNWKIAKWVALGVVVLEALVFFLALAVRAVNKPPEYDSDDEYIAPRSSVRQPLINNRQGAKSSASAASPSSDPRGHRLRRNSPLADRRRCFSRSTAISPSPSDCWSSIACKRPPLLPPHLRPDPVASTTPSCCARRCSTSSHDRRLLPQSPPPQPPLFSQGSLCSIYHAHLEAVDQFKVVCFAF